MACLIFSGMTAEGKGDGYGCTGHLLVPNSTSVSMKSLSVVCIMYDEELSVCNFKDILWGLLLQM